MRKSGKNVINCMYSKYTYVWNWNLVVGLNIMCVVGMINGHGLDDERLLEWAWMPIETNMFDLVWCPHHQLHVFELLMTQGTIIGYLYQVLVTFCKLPKHILKSHFPSNPNKIQQDLHLSILEKSKYLCAKWRSDEDVKCLYDFRRWTPQAFFGCYT